MENPIYPISLLKTAPPPPSGDLDAKDESALDDAPGKKKIVCRECGFKICDASFAIRVNGSHEHSFFNPHGYVFELRCFSSAPGCMTASPPSSEFSWFAGHTWQIGACALCSAHLGWKFQSGASTFYGLIKNSIQETDS
ncbi:cereblon family protein [Maridesulfovibrio sp. FT414]|uniref:cereblon family protein n=1 Tax=Maridesulfovibrio sp. FT414 TaxID=2979469 RepID=UPI003D803034